jgi:RHS repeat-associated protein
VAKTLEYDMEGRVKLVRIGGTARQFVYDYSGACVAHYGDSDPTFHFGDLFDYRIDPLDAELTKHTYLNGQRVAQSTMGIPYGLLARNDSPEGLIQLARVIADAVWGGGPVYPRYAMAAEDAAKLGALLLIVLIILDLTPGRVRLGVFGKVRRGHVMVFVFLFGLSLTPLTCLRRADAGGGGGGGTPPPPSPPPSYPTYFVHRDHLGSTVLLTCYQQSGCTDGAQAQYYRYDGYGTLKALTTTGAAVTSGSELTDLLYTGQRWHSWGRLYDYGARFYAPRIARFVSTDPVREYMNPYAYVAWNPVMRTDPTGMTGDLWGTAVGFSSLGYNGDDRGRFATLAGIFAGASTLGGPSAGAAAVNAAVWGGSWSGFSGVGGGAGVGLSQFLFSSAFHFDVSISFGVGGRFGGVEAIAGMGVTLADVLVADYQEARGGLYGHLSQLVRGASGIAKGVISANWQSIKEGLYNLITTPGPKAGNTTGLNHPGTTGSPSPFPDPPTRLHGASFNHDDRTGRVGFSHSAPHLQWIAEAWAGPGVPPGSYGLTITLVGTVVFGVGGGVLWLAGR